MRIALLNAQVPFVRGGAELLAEGLQRELQREGHEAEIVSLPFNWHPSGKLMDSMLAGQMIDLDELGGLPADLAIGLKFPAYLAKHANKRFWLVHQHRQAYDHWQDGSSDLLRQPDGQLVKGAIEAADRAAFSGRDIYTISGNVSKRLKRFLDIDSIPVYHPPPLAPLMQRGGEALGDYILVPSRIGPAKRQLLVVEALAKCREPVRLVFAGKPDDPAYERRIRETVERLKLADRTEWLSAVPAPALAELYAKARGVVFVPVDEDYGYITLEAMLSARPVITSTDAGGPLEFIRHEREGLVAAPRPADLAEAMDRVWAGDKDIRDLGSAALARYDAFDIGWPQVLDRLLDRDPASRPAAAPAEDTAHAAAIETMAAAPAVSLPEDEGRALAAMLAADEAALTAKLPEEARTLDGVLDSFDLGRHASPEVRNYLNGHWLRYLETLSLVPHDRRMKVLDLGGGKPHAFLGLIRLTRDVASFAAIVESEYEATGTEFYASTRGREPLTVETRAANLETTRLPFEDDSFDVLLAMEVLEHLALNPAHMFAEAARVLRPGGSLIVTTPNIISYRAVWLARNGHAPYSFGVFVPYHGVYGRHNREYAPNEVDLLGSMTGFITDTLATCDVYRGEIERFLPILPTLKGDPFPLALRGQNIFYRGVKTGETKPVGDNPLYLDDPFSYRGAMRAEVIGTGAIRLFFSNTGRKDWTSDVITMRLAARGADSSVRTTSMDLPITVPAGTVRSIDLEIAPRSGEATCVMSLELEQAGRGWLHHVGVPNIRFVAAADAIDVIERGRG